MPEVVKYSKFEKSEVGFEHPAEGKDHCSQCMYFEVFGPKKCAIVTGVILPTDWCEEFRAGKKLDLGKDND